MVRLDELIRQARDLAPLPASTLRLAGLISSANADLDEICEVIAYDQSLTLALLRAANSAAHAGVSDISQVYEAVFRLGSGRVLALAMSVNTGRMLKQRVPAYGLSEGGLWRHSVAAVAAAETISEKAAEEVPPESFTAALLHDVGKLVMGRYLSDLDLEMIYRARIDAGLSAVASESQVLSVHHGELGGIIAQHWKLPEPIVKGIIYHHTPADGRDLICDTVYLANLIANHIEQGGQAPDYDRQVLNRLGMSLGQMPNVVEAAKSNYETVKARYRAG